MGKRGSAVWTNGQLTDCGDGLGRWGLLALALCLAPSLAGCAGHVTPAAQTLEDRAAATTVVRDREAWMASLRAELATTRIAGAKKEAEVQELRTQLGQLRQENAEIRQSLLELKRGPDSATRSGSAAPLEREQQLFETQAQHLTSLKETIVALTQEVSLLRQGLKRPTPKSTPRTPLPPAKPGISPKPDVGSSSNAPLVPSALPPSAPSVLAGPPSKVKRVSTDGQPEIVVKPGDTLIGLARQYGVTVGALRDVNDLKGDDLVVGQRLLRPNAKGLR